MHRRARLHFELQKEKELIETAKKVQQNRDGVNLVGAQNVKLTWLAGAGRVLVATMLRLDEQMALFNDF